MKVSTLKVRLLPFKVSHITNLGELTTIYSEGELRIYQYQMIQAWRDVSMGLIGYKTWRTIDPDYNEAKNARLSKIACINNQLDELLTTSKT